MNWIRKFQKILFSPVLDIKAKRLSEEIEDSLPSRGKVIDLGCGDMKITQQMMSRSRTIITGVDVVNTSLTDLKPVLYDGKILPFKNGYFDAGYVIFTLHHCDEEVEVLKELVRVCKGQVIIIEEIYENLFEKYITYLNDWISNRLESLDVNIPFHFHTDSEWKQIFRDLGCRVVYEKRVYQLPWWLTRQTMYVIEKPLVY